MVSNLKDLEKLLKLLRKQGVMNFSQDGLSIVLGDLPTKPQGTLELNADSQTDPENPWENFPQGELSAEQLAFYSSGGQPGEEPEGLLSEDQQGKA